MASTKNISSPACKAVIGPESDFWIYHSVHGLDLSRPEPPKYARADQAIVVPTTTQDIIIDPSKSALVIIDMQNFFLSEALGRTPGPGHEACRNLIDNAIPAARKVGMRVVWLNWGLTDEDMRTMPPAITRCFGFYAVPEEEDFQFSPKAYETMGIKPIGVDRFGKSRVAHGIEAMYHGLGSPMGEIKADNGQTVDAGRLLYRDTWNAAIYPPLKAIYDSSTDIIIHKNRMSGLWGSGTPFEKFLEEEGLKTLFFAGVNTDQCVGGTLTDAFSKGYDCILLRDGCGTTSGKAAQEAWEYNAERTYGFCTDCEALAKGVDRMETFGEEKHVMQAQ